MFLLWAATACFVIAAFWQAGIPAALITAGFCLVFIGFVKFFKWLITRIPSDY